MKKILVVFFLLFSLSQPSFAISGDCAWHGGVACDKGADWDGSVICADGWTDSQDDFRDVQECQDQLLTYEDKLRHDWLTNSNKHAHYLEEICGHLGIDYYSYYINKSNSYKKIDPFDTESFEKCMEEKSTSGFRVTIQQCQTSPIEMLLDYISADLQAYNDTSVMCGNSRDNLTAFSDVSASHAYASSINYVKSQGIVDGYSDGSYKPDQLINRAEFTKIIIEAAYPNEVKWFISTNFSFPSQCFTDVPTDKWFTLYVCMAKEKGIINGYSDGSFKPEQNINNLEALKITIESFYDSVPNIGGDWYEKYIEFASTRGLSLKAWVNLGQNISRGEMAELIYRVVKDTKL
jgi:hypothetical protein